MKGGSNVEGRVYAQLDLYLKAGQMMLENGAETYRAEDCVLFMFSKFGKGAINVFAIPTSITIDITLDGRHYAGTRSIRRRGINLKKVDQVNTISRKVSNGTLEEDAAMESLLQIDKENEQALWLPVTASALAAGTFALMLNGGALEFLFAALFCAVVRMISVYTQKSSTLIFFQSLLGGFIPALAAFGVHAAIQTLDVNIVVIASMLPLFPGVATINAIRDTINGDLVSGVARGAEAIITAVALAIGAAAVYSMFL